jgi:16S rRNA (uracil1498-N3)-methyltransferase
MNNSLPPQSKPQARVPRLYCPGDLSAGATRNLPEPAAHHAARVLRVNAGDPLIVFNGEGGEVHAQVVAVGKRGVSIRIGRWHEREAESPVAVSLVQGLSARERMDFTVQKAVELGVAEIFPVETRRSVMRLAHERAERRVEHWQNLAISACEQSGRNRVPRVHAVSALSDWLGAHPADADLRLILSAGSESSLRDLSPPTRITLLAGPEGGFAPEELEMTLACGFTAMRLGPRILRTETAAIAALGAIQVLWGDF